MKTNDALILMLGGDEVLSEKRKLIKLAKIVRALLMAARNLIKKY